MYTRLLISASLHWFLACLSGMSLQVDYSREVSATDYSIPIPTIIRSPPLLPCQFPSLQDLVSPSPPTSIKKKPLSRLKGDFYDGGCPPPPPIKRWVKHSPPPHPNALILMPCTCLWHKMFAICMWPIFGESFWCCSIVYNQMHTPACHVRGCLRNSSFNLRRQSARSNFIYTCVYVCICVYMYIHMLCIIMYDMYMKCIIVYFYSTCDGNLHEVTFYVYICMCMYWCTYINVYIYIWYMSLCMIYIDVMCYRVFLCSSRRQSVWSNFIYITTYVYVRMYIDIYMYIYILNIIMYINDIYLRHFDVFLIRFATAICMK